jgi:hypothetical protein
MATPLAPFPQSSRGTKTPGGTKTPPSRGEGLPITPWLPIRDVPTTEKNVTERPLRTSRSLFRIDGLVYSEACAVQIAGSVLPCGYSTWHASGAQSRARAIALSQQSDGSSWALQWMTAACARVRTRFRCPKRTGMQSERVPRPLPCWVRPRAGNRLARNHRTLQRTNRTQLRNA